MKSFQQSGAIKIAQQTYFHQKRPQQLHSLTYALTECGPYPIANCKLSIDLYWLPGFTGSCVRFTDTAGEQASVSHPSFLAQVIQKMTYDRQYTTAHIKSLCARLMGLCPLRMLNTECIHRQGFLKEKLLWWEIGLSILLGPNCKISASGYLIVSSHD